jgi:hypothetical protein
MSMQNRYKKLVWRFRLLCLFWSVTFLSIGIAFVYASLYECVNADFDLVLKAYSVGASIVGMITSTTLSVNTYFYRKGYERSTESAE